MQDMFKIVFPLVTQCLYKSVYACFWFQRRLCCYRLHSVPVGVLMKQMTSEETSVSATLRTLLKTKSKYTSTPSNIQSHYFAVAASLRVRGGHVRVVGKLVVGIRGKRVNVRIRIAF